MNQDFSTPLGHSPLELEHGISQSCAAEDEDPAAETASMNASRGCAAKPDPHRQPPVSRSGDSRHADSEIKGGRADAANGP